MHYQFRYRQFTAEVDVPFGLYNRFPPHAGMQGSDVNFTQRKVAAYHAKLTDYSFQLPRERQQQFSADNRETELNLYGVKPVIKNEFGEIVQQAQIACEQPFWGRLANAPGKPLDFPST